MVSLHNLVAPEVEYPGAASKAEGVTQLETQGFARAPMRQAT